MFWDRRRGRTYKSNFELSYSLYSKNISSLNARMGNPWKVMPYNIWSVKDDLWQHEILYGKQSRDAAKHDWKATVAHHDMLVKPHLMKDDTSRFRQLDGPYWRRLWPSTDSFGRTRIGYQVHCVETNRTEVMRSQWMKRREIERKERLREVYHPVRSTILKTRY